MPRLRYDRDVRPSEITPESIAFGRRRARASGCIVLHVRGVAYASWRQRENLVAAMISGRKRP